MYALACSPKFKLGSGVTDPDREISRETGSRVGGGDATGEEWSCWRCKGRSAVSNASSLTIEAKNGVYSAPFLLEN